MIAKLQSITYLRNALAYCERGGELLDSHKCLGLSNDIHQQMTVNNALNDRCLKKSFHIKIRIAPEDKGVLSSQDWIDISKDYATKIGFEKNPYVTYIHEEGSEKEHIHIVASRVKDNYTAVSNSYTHYKNMDFCRAMERKYNLRKVDRKLEKLKKQEIFVSNDKRLPPLKEKIKTAIQNSGSMTEMIAILKNNGVAVKIGRGITFTDSQGASFKGSQIDRQFSLKKLGNSIENKKQQQIQIRR